MEAKLTKPVGCDFKQFYDVVFDDVSFNLLLLSLSKLLVARQTFCLEFAFQLLLA